MRRRDAQDLQRPPPKLHTYNAHFIRSLAMAIYELDGKSPQLGTGAWVADNATVIGDVIMGDNASVWFGSVVRGDTDTIRIGANTNIQDLSVLHADLGVPLTIGDNVTVGHQVMLHGCTIGDNTLIGIQAVVLNNARIGRNCIVGAGAVVTEGKEFPDNSLIVGAPAKVIRQLDEAAAQKLLANADHYVGNAKRYQRTFRKID
jgi:carbonic anhydrase/acetyltransferase-like protein (isoleucine patch superfamily)